VPNEKSERFHAQMGFHRLCVHEKDGYKLGAWHDVLWMERNIGDHPNPPRSLLPWTALNPSEISAILHKAALTLPQTD